jgi:hypothetical protein
MDPSTFIILWIVGFTLSMSIVNLIYQTKKEKKECKAKRESSKSME